MPEEPGGSSAGADLVPDHLGHHRRAVIGNHEHLQAVGEGEFRRARRGLGAVKRYGNRHRGKAEPGEDEARPEIERARKLIEHQHHHSS